MDETGLATLVADISLWSTAVIGAASLIVQGIAVITGITPTTRDDEIVGKVQSVLRKLQGILGFVALNEVKAKAPTEAS